MLKAKRVLLVDDSSTIRMYLRSVLIHTGAIVEEATSGEDALRQLQANPPYDLILLDLILPDIDGIEVLHRLRALDEDSAVVMLTGMGGIKSATTAVREGADGYMEKKDLALGSDHAEFFYALQQAMEHRLGLVAQPAWIILEASSRQTARNSVDRVNFEVLFKRYRDLLMAKGRYGVKVGGADGRIEAEDNADGHADTGR